MSPATPKAFVATGRDEQISKELHRKPKALPLERGGAPTESGQISKGIHRTLDVRVNTGTAQLGAKWAY